MNNKHDVCDAQNWWA